MSSLSRLLADFSPVPGDARLYLRPLALLTGAAAAELIGQGQARPLAGSATAFTAVQVWLRHGGRTGQAVAPLPRLRDWADHLPLALRDRLTGLLDRLSAPRPPFAGLALDRPLVMGIVNVTPDSFSDGGRFVDPQRAIAHGEALLADGADLLDIGGESTRPGAEPIAPAVELDRILPVVRHFAGRTVVSVDTRHAAVMRAASAAGAAIFNDITALTGDPDSLPLAATAGIPSVLMHMQGDPRTMQDQPRYDDAALDVYDYLADRIAAATAAGLPRAAIAADPGIGFGKTLNDNCRILAATGLYHGLGVPLLIGVSRKRFIAGLSRNEPPADRLGGSLAAALAALDQGAQILRVHDVAATVQARAVWAGLRQGRGV